MRDSPMPISPSTRAIAAIGKSGASGRCVTPLGRREPRFGVEGADATDRFRGDDGSLADLIAMVQTLLLDGLQSPDLRAAQIALGSP